MSAAGRSTETGAAPVPALREPSRAPAATRPRGRSRPGTAASLSGRVRASSPARARAAGRASPPAPAEGLGNGPAKGRENDLAKGVAHGFVEGLATGLAPVIDGRVHTLILGSFPSRASLARGQYYGHPRNHFWPLLQAVLGEPLVELPYERRLETLLARGIGLWDVIGRCDRPGSLDSDIRRAERNAFDALLESLPRLARVFFNGATAGRAAPTFAAHGLAVRVLPSSSPALTIGLPAKLAAWAAIAGPVAAGAGSTGTAGIVSAAGTKGPVGTVGLPGAARTPRAARATRAAALTLTPGTPGAPGTADLTGMGGTRGTADGTGTPGTRGTNRSTVGRVVSAAVGAEHAAGSVRRERGRVRSTPRVAAQPARAGRGKPAC